MNFIQLIGGKFYKLVSNLPIRNVGAAVEDSDVIIKLQFKNYGNVSPRKVYRAILSQTGANAPEAIVVENTIGNIVWSYAGVGNYYGTLTSAFTTGKTWFISANQADMSTIVTVNSADQVQITTYSDIATAADNMMFTLAIEISVYQ